MATRSSKRSVYFSSSQSGTSARTSDSPASDSGVSSPLSPTRMSRIEEKEQLQHLNDRLSQYIDRVRQLETENQRLSYQIKSTEETVTKERNNVKDAYEHELADARRLLDDTAKERARLQIECGKYKAQVDELLGKVARLEKDLKDSEGRRLNAEAQAHDLNGKLNNAENQRRHAQDEAKKAKAEAADLRKQLDAARQQLEEETLLRVDLENRLQSLREELAFNKQLYDRELDETRRKRQTEITEINTKMEEDYRQKLQDGLRDMRDEFDIRLGMSRKEVEDMYDRKLQDLRDQSERNSGAAAGAREQLQTLRMQVDNLQKERDGLESRVSGMEKRIRELESELVNQRDSFYARLTSKEEEIRRLENEIQEMMHDYKDLMDTKIRLDTEIEAYRRLLEAEETRLNMSATAREMKSSRGTSTPSSAAADQSAPRGAKRKRVLQERDTVSSASYHSNKGTKGFLQIEESDIDGQFIRISNVSNEDVPLGGWMLRRMAGGVEVAYKFHRAFILRAGKSVTIWSSDQSVTHSPPSDLVMKNQRWPVGDKIRTVLVDPNGEDYAWRESSRTAKEESFSIRAHGPGAQEAMDGIEHAESNRCSVM